MQKFAIFLMAVAFIAVAQAGTVALTGTCSQSNQSRLSFTLSNNGNDTALNFRIVPTLKDTTTNSSEYFGNSLVPGSSAEFNITLESHPESGSYAYYYTVAYQQAGTVFTAVFPCLVQFGNSTQSQVLLSYNSASLNGENLVNVSAFNSGSAAIEDNISMILPPSFTYISPAQVNIEIQPMKYGSASFVLQGQAPGSYSGAVVSSYTINGIAYATIEQTLLVQQSQQMSSPLLNIVPGTIVEILAIVVVAMLVILIVRAYLKKRRTHHGE